MFTMEMIITYLIYVLGLAAAIFMFLYFYAKITIFRTKRDILNDLIDKGYETDTIDLNKFLKS